MILTVQELKQHLQIREFPCQIIGNGAEAIVTVPGHKYTTGEYLCIFDSTSFNGIYLIEKVDMNTLKFKSDIVASESGIISKDHFYINSLTETVNSHINSYCGLEYGNESSLKEKYTIKHSIIFLKRGYIGDDNIVSIKLSLESDFNDPEKYEEIDPRDYMVSSSHIELTLVHPKYIGKRNALEIEYTTKPCPPELKQAAIALAEYMYLMNNDKASNVLSISQTTTTKSFDKKVPETIEVLINPYVRHGIGI